MEPNIEMGQKIYQQCMDIFIVPEINERRKSGKIGKSFDLSAAQIIFFPDGKKPEVKLNNEIRAIGDVKLKVSKKKGDLIYEHDIDGIQKIRLPENEYPDCGHATFLLMNNVWNIFFDFRYNKSLSKRHQDAALEFIEAARNAKTNKQYHAFVDNLFSACELIARASLLFMPDPKFRRKGTHRDIQIRYNRFASLGNVNPEHVKALNKLSGLRDRARYLRDPIKISEQSADELFSVVENMIQQCIKFFSA
jgi:hypothetical protein